MGVIRMALLIYNIGPVDIVFLHRVIEVVRLEVSLDVRVLPRSTNYTLNIVDKVFFVSH